VLDTEGNCVEVGPSLSAT